ncbi:hypothetical protein [Methylobacter luteus]|uniref:hypothetical protein n=1 Tax=Methylobacter luteus TaxID=415 RepID=UPI000488B212|nr:hypothetical protein [Methylobacter luteus]
MNKLLKRIAGLLAAGILGIVAFFGYIYFTLADDPFNNREFDREVWVSFYENMDPDNPRGEMYEDLVASHLRKGMKRMEVVALLGKPDVEDVKNLLSYNLGMWSGFRIDYDSLDIALSDDGVLVGVRRVQH